MYIELRHLRTIRAIQQAGGLARAADVLNMTQSALSHQVAGLEAQAGMELFVRRSKPMRLSAAGVRMLRAAERILPEIDAMEEEFRALRAGRTVLWVEAAKLFAAVHKAYTQDRSDAVLEAHATPSLLVLDEIALRDLPADGEEILFAIFDHRHKQGLANPMALGLREVPRDSAGRIHPPEKPRVE